MYQKHNDGEIDINKKENFFLENYQNFVGYKILAIKNAFKKYLKLNKCGWLSIQILKYSEITLTILIVRDALFFVFLQNNINKQLNSNK